MIKNNRNLKEMTGEKRSEDSEHKKTKKTRIPLCTRCKNHGLKIPTLYHSKVCSFSDCSCFKCDATKKRQIEMKEQTAKRREKAREKAVNFLLFKF